MITENGLIIAPKTNHGAITYLLLQKDGQCLVTLKNGRRKTEEIADVMGRYPFLRFFSETVKCFRRDYIYETDRYGVTRAELLLRTLQWDTSGGTLLIGCAGFGWFLYRKEDGVYRYVRPFCGTKRYGFGGTNIDYADGLLQDFRAEKYFKDDLGRFVFAGYYREAHWYLCQLDPVNVQVIAFRPLEACCDVQYLPESRQLLVFSAAEERSFEDCMEEPRPLWNRRLLRCDDNGQTLEVLECEEPPFCELTPHMPCVICGNVLVRQGCGETEGAYALDLATGKTEQVHSGGGCPIGYSGSTGRIVYLEKGNKNVWVLLADPDFSMIRTVAIFATDAAPSQLRYISGDSWRSLVLADGTVYAAGDRPGGTRTVAQGADYRTMLPYNDENCLFECLMLMYGDYHSAVRLYLDTVTGDVITADVLPCAPLIPITLFRENGSVDAEKLGAWLRENNIPRRDYSLAEDIEAMRRHKWFSLPTVDPLQPPEQCFWLGSLLPSD